MKVSIITSCYNREATIRGSIESVLGQTHEDIEYIVVDGASKDGSLGVINEYKGRIARIVSEPDKGMYEGINKGLRLATGDIIGLVHSDDYLYDKGVIGRIAGRFAKGGLDIVYGNGIFVDFANTDTIRRDWISGRYTKAKMRRGWLPLHPTVYVTREWLDKCGLYDERYKIAADTDWLIRSLYDMEPRVEYMDEYIVRMRMGGLSTSPEKTRKKWAEDMRIYKAHGIEPHIAIAGKVTSKIPQFVRAAVINRKARKKD